MATKIGVRDVKSMPPNTILWDSEAKGFNARRQKGDAITFSVYYRTQDQLQRWHRIGRYGTWTPDQARKEAQRILRARDLGEDPSGARMAFKNSPTVAQLCSEYVADMDAHRINGKKSSTIQTDKSRIKRYITPHLGKFKVASVTRTQIEEFMHEMSTGSARRIIGLTGAIFSYAVKKKLRTDNPAHGIETPKDNKKVRRLAVAEYAQLHTALTNGTSIVSDIFMLLTLTGWRSGEARLLRWTEVDIDRRVATLEDTKSGQSVRPLSTAAIEIIQRQQRTESEYVFPLRNGKPIIKLTDEWAKLGMAADVTPHTLRHSFASLAGDLGLPDSTIAGLLGHKQHSITSRYIHLDKALIAAADTVAGETMRLMRT
jgi:integrase